MFFLAGLLVAGLAGLLILPAFARRALRLSAARARMLAPLSMKEVVAERDLLRAEHAIEQHKLQRRLEALQDASAGHRADLGRQAAHMVALETSAEELNREIVGLRSALVAKERDLVGLEGELGASQIALHDFSGRLERATSALLSLEEEHVSLGTAADDQRTVIAGLETRISGLEMKLGDAAILAKNRAITADAETARLTAALASRTTEAARANAALNEALSKMAVAVADLEKKENELAATRRRLSAVETASAAANSRVRDAGNSENLAPPPVDGDLALRAAISRLAADVVRLSEGPTDLATPIANRAKSKRRESAAPPSQGPNIGDAAAPAKLRQLQASAPQR
jgi:chromosome segregation ATPase